LKGYINPYILKLIEQALADEEADYRLYTRMSEECTENADTFRAIALDEKKHFKMLTEMYTELKGREPGKVKINEKEFTDCNEAIKAQINEELEGATMYRTLYFALPMGMVSERNMIFEIMSDEMMHATALSGM